MILQDGSWKTEVGRRKMEESRAGGRESEKMIRRFEDLRM
jgi:hypothetical protein